MTFKIPKIPHLPFWAWTLGGALVVLMFNAAVTLPTQNCELGIRGNWYVPNQSRTNAGFSSRFNLTWLTRGELLASATQFRFWIKSADLSSASVRILYLPSVQTIVRDYFFDRFELASRNRLVIALAVSTCLNCRFTWAEASLLHTTWLGHWTALLSTF